MACKILRTENSSNTFTHTYNIQVNSQYIETKRKVYNQSIEKFETKKISGFFNPGNLTLAYGLNWKLWEFNYINFNFATIKITTKPRYNNYAPKDSNNLAKTKNSFIFCEYGMNINTMIYKKITDNITWENYTYYFMNGVSKKHIKLDFINRINFRFLKYIQFRVDTHIIYDSFTSFKLQYQKDFTLGFIYELKKKR